MRPPRKIQITEGILGQITERPREDGTKAYLARVRKKKGGKTAFNKTETFSRERDAKAWIKKTEADLKKGSLQHSNDRATLAEVIQMYLKETGPKFGKTKRQCLEYIATPKIGGKRCLDITSEHVMDLIREQSDGREPQTVGNYLSHLAAVFAVAEVAYKARLSMTEFNLARDTARHLKLIRRSGKRTRRPTIGEMR